MQDALLQLKGVLAAGFTSSQSERCSSFHRAKGLEADAVLVVATTPSELTKWLTVDRAARAGDQQDMCRVGYVAFTRAREMLCPACLKPLDNKTRQLLIDRGITILPSSGGSDGLTLYYLAVPPGAGLTGPGDIDLESLARSSLMPSR